MPREMVTVQVGQCGNQIGCRFWDVALREHAAINRSGLYDEALSSFFRNEASSTRGSLQLPVGSQISSLRARAVLIDTEEGVLKSTLSGPLGELFDSRHLVSDQYGAGNNWAQGHMEYGPKCREEVLESVRRTVETCESIQSFFLLHSLGGGTGSGLGTYVLSLLADHYPDVYRFTCSVFPSEDDDVVTSPYNAALALEQLSLHADCVLPIENSSLADICRRAEERGGARRAAGQATLADAGGEPRANSFDEMNEIAAQVLSHLTASTRFDGPLNVDLNEVTMNLVPFPRLKFLLSSLSPMAPAGGAGGARAEGAGSGAAVDALFSEALHRDAQLIKADPRTSTFLAAAFLARGDVPISDMQRNVARVRKSVRMVAWNPDGFKTGICAAPPQGVPRALLCLSNNCAIAHTVDAFAARFHRLYRRKAMVHHYERFLGPDARAVLDAAAENMRLLAGEYHALDSLPPGGGPAPRMVPAA